MIHDQQGCPASTAQERRSWVKAFRNRPQAAMEDPTAAAGDAAAPPPAKAKVSHTFAVLRLKLRNVPEMGYPCPNGVLETEFFGSTHEGHRRSGPSWVAPSGDHPGLRAGPSQLLAQSQGLPMVSSVTCTLEKLM